MLKQISKILAVLCFSFLLSLSVQADRKKEYFDLFVRVHVDTLDGQLYSFNPESVDATSGAFGFNFEPNSDLLDFAKNRDFARTIFLKIKGISHFAIFDAEANQSDYDVILLNAIDFPENSNSNDVFVLSPYDGFLHFKMSKNLVSELEIEMFQPAINNFRITEEDLNSIQRGAAPYGFNALVESENLFLTDVNPESQKIQIDLLIEDNPDVGLKENYFQQSGVPDVLTTYAQKLMIRAHHALNWVLQIDNESLEKSSIKAYYQKIINAVNALLILLILIVAVMWNFSILISREALKKTMIFYVLVSLLVNLSFPLMKLAVDGANLLQNTFLRTENRQIVASDFFDYGDLKYSEVQGYVLQNNELEYKIVTVSEGTIIENKLEEEEVEFTNSVSFNETAEEEGENVIIIPEKETNNLTTETTKVLVDQELEDRVFNSSMLILTAFSYFLIAGIFLCRIVILWFLLILSPLFFLLLILPTARQYFEYWASVFIRWIFLGPLLAICLGATVFIWKSVGVPITSMYSSSVNFPASSNLNLGLAYTKPMMEYIISLIMIYVPVFLAICLTRKIPTFSGTSVSQSLSSNTVWRSLKSKISERFQEKSKETSQGDASISANNLSQQLPFVQKESHLDFKKLSESQSVNNLKNVLSKEQALEQIERISKEPLELSGEKQKEDLLREFSNSSSEQLLERLQILNNMSSKEYLEKEQNNIYVMEKELIHKELKRRAVELDKSQQETSDKKQKTPPMEIKNQEIKIPPEERKSRKKRRDKN